MSPSTPFVTFVCAKDVHYCKALIGSLHSVFGSPKTHVVADFGTPEPDLRQMSRVQGVVVHRVSDLIKSHKFHFVGLLSKFNVFFLPGVEQAFIIDADSVVIRDFTVGLDRSAIYGSLHAHSVDLGEEGARKSFDSWAVRLDSVGELGGVVPVNGVHFASGSHFYVNVSRFPLELLIRMLPHVGYSHGHQGPLRAGDQGFWNYFLNFVPHAPGDVWVRSETIDADRCHSRLPSAVAVEALRSGGRVPVPFGMIHFVGRARRALLRQHHYGDALQEASRSYYALLGRRGYSRWDAVRRLTGLGMRKLRSHP
jgi:hypothetical protein